MNFGFLLFTVVILLKNSFLIFSTVSKDDQSSYGIKSFSEKHQTSSNDLFYIESDSEEDDELLKFDQVFLKQFSSDCLFKTNFDLNHLSLVKNLFLLFSAPPLYILFQQQKSFLS